MELDISECAFYSLGFMGLFCLVISFLSTCFILDSWLGTENKQVNQRQPLASGSFQSNRRRAQEPKLPSRLHCMVE